MSGGEAYWIYLTYAVGVISLIVIGYRKWWGWLMIAGVHAVFVLTGLFTGTVWLVLGTGTYFFVDLTMAYLWYWRTQRERKAAASFVDLIKRQFADGKREAIYELLRLERDIDELTGGGANPLSGRKREDQLIDWLRDEAAQIEAQQRDRDYTREERDSPGGGGATRVEYES